MADVDDNTQVAESGEGDVDMEAVEETQEQEDENKEDGEGGGEGAGDETILPNGVTPPNPQTIFLEYLKSPVVELLVGSGDETTTLTAHKAILENSSYFLDKLAGLSDDELSVALPDESLDAIACVLQYQYTGEYFPRRLADTPDSLEPDPTVPAIDNTGSQLLKHARVYTLAVKFGLPELKNLAHSKIHRINSTAVRRDCLCKIRLCKHPRGRRDDTEACGGILGDPITCSPSRCGIGIQGHVSGIPAVWL